MFHSIKIICHLFSSLIIVQLFTNRFSDTADGPPPLTGVFTPNNELQKAKRLFEGELVGAESFTADKDGNCY